MKKATVADLRNHFSKVSKWILEGEEVMITKRGREFAMLSARRFKRRPAKPVDRMARLQELYHNHPVAGDLQSILEYDRGNK